MNKLNFAFGLALQFCAAWAFGQSARDAQHDEASDPRVAVQQHTASLGAMTIGSAEEKQLRERIIDLAAKLKPPLALPEGAIKHAVRGETLARAARSDSDREQAATEYRAALKIAPWWADVYINYGLLEEALHHPSEAAWAYGLYLRAAPDAADAEQVRRRAYGQEALAERQRSGGGNRTIPASPVRSVPGAVHIPFAEGTADANSIVAGIGTVKRMQPEPWRSTNFLYEPGRTPATVIWDIPFPLGTPENLRAKELVATINSRGGVAGRKLVASDAPPGETRGWLGVTIQPVTADLATSFGLEKPAGALVSQVAGGGPASQAGLQPGDIILEIDGKTFGTPDELVEIVRALVPNRKVNMRVWRGGSARYFAATVGLRP